MLNIVNTVVPDPALIPKLRSNTMSKFERVLKAFRRGPISVQRDHGKRALKVKHLGKTLRGEQEVFSIVIWNGKERLVDGYTRVERILQGLTDKPERVGVAVYEDPYCMPGLMALYDQIDNPGVGKGASCRYDEGLRLEDYLNKFTSHLVTKGQKSAPQYATNAASVREGVQKAIAGMEFVDSLGLAKNHETLGMLAAYYAIALYADKFGAEVESFIRKMNQSVFAPKNMAVKDIFVEGAREFCEEKVRCGSYSGTTNVRAILGNVLYAFIGYLGREDLLVGVEKAMPLGTFHMLMQDILLAA